MPFYEIFTDFEHQFDALCKGPKAGILPIKMSIGNRM
jgi:hypothetical protein